MPTPPAVVAPSRDMRLVLASGSRFRAEILERAGFSVTARPVEIDERLDDYRLADEGPAATALVICARKLEAALAVPANRQALAEGWWLVAADQVGVREDVPSAGLTKPTTRHQAIEMIVASAGQRVVLHNAIGVVGPTPVDATPAPRFGTDRYEVAIGDISEDLAASYVDAEQPFDCVGGIRIEDCEPFGPWPLLDAGHPVESADLDGIRGMPLSVLLTLTSTH